MPMHVVVVGASSGGLDAVKTLVAGLPTDLAASLCVVLHTAADAPGMLGTIFRRAGRLPVVTVQTRERLEHGRMYLPVSDHHLIIEPGVAIATSGPKENSFRPAIDPLFRSAAQTYGPRVIGVVLTGGLDDGTAGLWAIKQLGGTAIVQDPDEAFASSMPRSALAHVRVDHCVRLSEMPELLVRLTSEPAVEVAHEVPASMEIEVNVAKEQDPLAAGVLELGSPSRYACPECHGVLMQVKEADRVRFRCHTGHAYSAASLLSELEEKIETSLWNAVRALQEKTVFLRHLAGHEEPTDDQSRTLHTEAIRTEERTELVRKALATDAP